MSVAVYCDVISRLTGSFPCHPTLVDGLIVVAVLVGAATVYLYRTDSSRQDLVAAGTVITALALIVPVIAMPLEISGGHRLPPAEMTDVVCQAESDTVYADVRVLDPGNTLVNASISVPDGEARPAREWSEMNTSAETQRSFVIRPPQDLVAGQRYIVAIAFEGRTVHGTCTP